MSIDIVKKLSGHSGCEIYLIKNESGFFIRKTAGRSEYNQRLRNQIAKQISFKPLQKNIHIPTVYYTGMSNNIFEVDMQYINCKTMADYIESVAITKIPHLIDMVINEFCVSESCVQPQTNEIFQKKIKTLYNCLPHNEIFNVAMNRLSNHNFGDVPKSKCHGDLTLENILINVNNDIYLIDFLDSFFDSYMIDFAKLLQDLELYWSYRNKLISPNLELRLLVAKETLIEYITKLPNGKNNLIHIYYILLMNVMRIVPYVSDDITKQWLENSIHKLFNILNTMENKK